MLSIAAAIILACIVLALLPALTGMALVAAAAVAVIVGTIELFQWWSATPLDAFVTVAAIVLTFAFALHIASRKFPRW